jgi:hypothetical protein
LIKPNWASASAMYDCMTVNIPFQRVASQRLWHECSSCPWRCEIGWLCLYHHLYLETFSSCFYFFWCKS